MDCTLWVSILKMTVAILTFGLSPIDCNWQKEWRPNYKSDDRESLKTPEFYEEGSNTNESFRILFTENNRLYLGAKNRIYTLVFGLRFDYSASLIWEPDADAKSRCNNLGRKFCDNYITVFYKINGTHYFICGTYAFSPSCRYFTLLANGTFHKLTTNDRKDIIGIGYSPFNPDYNSTAIFTDGRSFTAVTGDASERDHMIVINNISQLDRVRTTMSDSSILNDPSFVSSFEKDDKVYFFFREVAIENINCGKAVFSRVARVCKQDRGFGISGGSSSLTMTSFFKARLNCSIPGPYPFHFDEIQSTSELGYGNNFSNRGLDKTYIIYGVFNTPENSIRGSAVCAFTYSSIQNVFNGNFKGQESHLHNWLSKEAPKPHPAQCRNNNQTVKFDTVTFGRKHPLMNEAVPPAGGRPLLLFTSFKTRFTQITIAWQVKTSDDKFYDVMFVGTADGRVIKAINNGSKTAEPVVIEDIQVLDPGDSVIGIKIMKKTENMAEDLLIVSSKRSIVGIFLSRCHRVTTCRKCVALQDPYCWWDTVSNKCTSRRSAGNMERIQNVHQGVDSRCPLDEAKANFKVTSTPRLEKRGECSCLDTNATRLLNEEINDSTGIEKSSVKPSFHTTTGNTEEADEGRVISRSLPGAKVSSEILIIAVIVSVIASTVCGFFIGYKFQACRYRSRDTSLYNHHCSSLQRSRKRIPSGDNPYFHTDFNLSPKQVNYVVNVKPGKMNTDAEIKPVTKSSKVYL